MATRAQDKKYFKQQMAFIVLIQIEIISYNL